LFYTETRASAASKMEYARPLLTDEVAREFPDLRIVISQLGHPWTEETMVLMAKHEHVYADISGLLRDPWYAYNVLLSAYQTGVMDRLLFGSGFPYTLPATCIESLYSVNQVCHGTSLPTIPREQLRRIVERDALGLLGIESSSKSAVREPDTTVIKAED
jgi:predicted TIM-barrel fold metal-dependent hydrolase